MEKRVGMEPATRYRDGDNSVLRSVLYDVWNCKCYWCGRPKDYTDVQIDHIIPRGTNRRRLQQLIYDYGLPDTFDLHDVRNLAPICSLCNGPSGKGDKEPPRVPVVLDKLRRAEILRPEVIDEVIPRAE
jgi:5-methylcytosine-specific restriction endonuclease McrA